MKLVEFYSNLKDKIDDDEIVTENFQNIFAKFKKGNNVNKEAFEEIEKKFFAGEKINVNKPKTGKENKENLNSNVLANKNKKRIKRNYSKMKNGDNDSESALSENENTSKKPGPNSKLNSNIKSVSNHNIVNSNIGGRINTRSALANNKKVVKDSDSEDIYADDYDDSDY